MTPTAPASEVLLEVESLSKTFPGQVALDGASLHVRRGQIHALLGLNGSGKSTLIKVISGYHREDEGGVVHVFGVETPAHQVRSSHPGRVAVLHQDLALLRGMSVAENMGLGASFRTSRAGRIQWGRQREEARDACRRLGLHVDPSAAVGSLEPSAQVIVGLARAIRSLDQIDGSIIFADEPTAALGSREVDRVFGAFRELASAGAAVVVVTHRLEEVLAHCDALTVLRDGRTIAEQPTAGLDKAKLAAMLTGRADGSELVIGDTPEGPVIVPGEPAVLAVRRLRGQVIESLSFEIAAGEVLGIAGLVGSGREELGPLIVGALPRVSGQVLVDGREVGPSTREATRAGMGVVPADRKRQGIFASMSVGQNMTVNSEPARFSGAWLDARAAQQEVDGWIRRVHLEPPDRHRKISLLSGGNQQKVVLARWLRRAPRVMVLDDPMQGVDVAAKTAIYRIVREAAAAGSAILLISSDSIELEEAADRVLVLRNGRIGAELSGAQRTSERIVMEVEG